MLNYNLFAFGGMIGPNSKVRVDAYAEALRQAITPDSVVLEIGSGPGYFALLAAKFGAKHVYAVDPSPTVNLGAKLAEANGLADRITFIQQLSTELQLPERADLCVSDIRGALPWLTHHIASIVDARRRLLTPDAALIPRQDTVWGSIVDAPGAYAPHVAPWDDNIFGLDLGLARARTTNHVRKVLVEAETMLVAPHLIATLDYATIAEPSASAELDWQVQRSGIGHGMVVWFETELAPGIEYSNRPGQPRIPIYSQMFFPWTGPVQLSPGDRVRTEFGARLVKEKYVYSWQTRVENGSTGELMARFTQSSFAAEALLASPDEDGDQTDEI